MSTLKDQFVALMTATAEDYHRDFAHNKNAKAEEATTWRQCKAGRCQRFAQFIAAFPGSIDDEMALVGEDLRRLQKRVNAALAALTTPTSNEAATTQAEAQPPA
jgi:hypothetical protein